jgi:hypothetical protein
MSSRSAAAPHASHRPTAIGRLLLSLVLGARALANGFFAAWLWSTSPAWSDFFAGAASYLVVDGALAMAAAILLSVNVLEGPALLTGATAADGVARVAAGVALRMFPGLPDFPVTAVAFFGVVGGWAACVATAAIVVRASVWRARHHAHRSTPLAMHEELDPLVIAGIVALGLVGYTFLNGPPVTLADYRSFGMLWTSVLAVAFASAAVGVKGTIRLIAR